MAKVETRPQYVKTADEILALKVTKTPMLIQNLLQKKGMAVLSGSSDTGKSYLSLFIAATICGSQDKIFGYDINKTHSSTIVVCSEDSPEDMCVRLTGLLSQNSIDQKNLRFLFDVDNLIVKLKKELNRQAADLIVLDTFGDLYKGNINDSISIRQFLMPFKKLADEFNCLLLFTHHIGKGKESSSAPSKNDVLGSQGIESACRTVLMLRKDADNQRSLTVVKGNYIPEEHKDRGLLLSFDTGKGFEATGKTINYLDSKVKPETNIAMIEEVLILYPTLKSYQKVADAMKKKGHKKIDKNKVGDIWKKHNPSVLPPLENDGRTEDESDTLEKK